MSMKKIALIVFGMIFVLGVSAAAVIFFAGGDTQASDAERGRIENNATTVIAKGPEEQGMEDTEKNVALPGNIMPQNVDHIGSHIYVTDNVFRDRNLAADEEKKMIEYLKDADQYLTEDILVVGWSYSSITDELRFNARQYLAGVEVPEVTYWSELDGSHRIVQTDPGTPVVTSVDTAGLIDPISLIPVVEQLAKQHESEIYMDRDHKVYGEYHTEYDVNTKELYYVFNINEYSEISIDARTGQVLREYYFNGEYVD